MLEPVLVSALLVTEIVLGEVRRLVGADEGQDEIEGSRLDHGGLQFLVGDERADGQAGVVAHAVVVAERQREEPLGDLALGHHLLVVAAPEQRQVGEGLGTAPQHVQVAAATPVQDDVQAAQVDHPGAGLLRQLEQILQDPRRCLGKLAVPQRIPRHLHHSDKANLGHSFSVLYGHYLQMNQVI